MGKTAGSVLSRAPLVQNRPTQPALLLDEAQGCVVRTSIRAIEHFLSEGVGVVGPADRSVETQLSFAAAPSSRISPTKSSRSPITCHLSLSLTQPSQVGDLRLRSQWDLRLCHAVPGSIDWSGQLQFKGSYSGSISSHSDLNLILIQSRVGSRKAQAALP